MLKLITTAALAFASALPARADGLITLTFEGAVGYDNAIGEFYNGGTDSLGHSGTNYGVSFTDATIGLSNDNSFTYYSNAPTPGTVIYAYDGSATMNVAQGITGQLTFFYSASQPVLDAVSIWSGPNGTGTLLATASLFGNATIGCNDTAYCRFDLTSVKFAGVAQSVNFGGNAPFVAYDNISFTSAVPEPESYLLLAGGLLGVVLAKRRRAD